MSEQCMICGKPYRMATQEACGRIISIPMPTCDCEAREMEKQRLAEDHARKMARVAALNLPPIFAPWWLKNLECEHAADARIYVEGFTPRKSKGLFLCGSNGNGKSTLAAVICKELAYRGRRVLFTTMTEMLEDENGVTYPYVLHAEANAITKVARSNNSSDGSTLYVTASPCVECAKLIIQAGISRVVYAEKYRLTDGLDLLEKAGVVTVHLPLDDVL